MNNQRMKICAFAAISIIAAASVSQAVSVPLGSSGWALIVNKDIQEVGKIGLAIFDVTGDSVVIELDKTFYAQPNEFNVFAPMSIEFQKISANAVSRIVIQDEYIVNDTTRVWSDFHMIIPVNIINPEAGFDSRYIPAGGQLENVSFANNYGYNQLPTQLNFVNAVDGGVNFAPAGEDVFRPGYASGDIVILTNPDLAVGERFMLKEIPTFIPEPTTIALLVFGLFPAIMKRKRCA